MLTGIKKYDINLLQKIIAVLHDWSGATDDTPEDTEIISSDKAVVTLGDLQDAAVVLDNLSQLIHSQRAVNDGQAKD